jgi:hypothetical protein
MPTPKTGAPGTTDQKPRWEGPPENRPSGYLPAEDDPSIHRDAAGENLQDPNRSNLSDAVATKDYQPSREDRIRTRAHHIWEEGGRTGSPEDHWYQAEREIDAVDQPASARSATPSPEMGKLGAGPAIAEHSKDAKAAKAGRQPGAYAKD